MNWIRISLILCMFGCLKDFRPSESFVTDYLTGPWKNFTATEVNQDIYPVSTYSYFATLVLMFLITDFVRYKPIILLCGLSGAACFLTMILGHSILSMQILEFLYGLFLSSETAYYTYMYAKVDKKNYQEVTGHAKAASLFGRSMAGVIAQLTASFNLLDYHQLNYLTLAALILATIWALFLPSVGQSIYFHRQNPIYEENLTTVNGSMGHTNNIDRPIYGSQQQLQQTLPKKDASRAQMLKNAYIRLWNDFVSTYMNVHVIKWSAFWAFSTCGYLQVANYAQLLWQTAVGPDDKIYNGAVDALYAIIGALTVFCIGKIPFNWELIGDATLSLFSFGEGVLLIVCAMTDNIFVMYVCYIAFGVIYHTMQTVANFEVAKYTSEDSYGLMFGVNTFFSLLLQSLLTLIVLNGSLALGIRSQYYVYGGYYVVLGAVFLLTGIVVIVKYRRSGKKFTIWSSEKTILDKAQTMGNGRTADAGATVLV